MTGVPVADRARAARLRVEPGALLVLGAAVCWGTTGTLQALAPEAATSLSIGAARLVIGGSALLLFAAARGRLPGLRRLPPWQTLLAGLAVAAYQLCFFAGVRRAGVAVGTLVAIGSAPVVAGALAALFLRERPGLRWAAATALAVAGCVLLAGIGHRAGGAVEVNPLGILLALGAGASYATYTLASTRVVAAVPPELAAAATLGLGALFLLPVLLRTDTAWLVTPRGAAAALALGLVATAAPYIMYNRALRSVKAGAAVTLTLGEPLVASLLGIFYLGERLDARGLLGLLLIGAALLTLTLQRTAPALVAAEIDHASTS